MHSTENYGFAAKIISKFRNFLQTMVQFFIEDYYTNWTLIKTRFGTCEMEQGDYFSLGMTYHCSLIQNAFELYCWSLANKINVTGRLTKYSIYIKIYKYKKTKYIFKSLT